MLGAKSQLEAKGFKVDAAESRQGKEVVDVLARLRAAGQLGNIVVIHIGTNGEVSDETFAAIMANLPPDEVTTVWFLTVRRRSAVDRRQQRRIVALPCKYPNVWVGYWADLRSEHRGHVKRRHPSEDRTRRSSSTPTSSLVGR